MGALSRSTGRKVSGARLSDAPCFPEGRVGLISDTHGLLRPEALAYLEGSTVIVHAGDIGGTTILDSLRAIAPLLAVRGNNDSEPGSRALKESELVRIGEVLVYVIHDRADITVDLRLLGVSVVITGHSHKPSLDYQDDILFVNPGSAGPRRFKLPISIGELRIEAGRASAALVNLMDGSALLPG